MKPLTTSANVFNTLVALLLCCFVLVVSLPTMQDADISDSDVIFVPPLQPRDLEHGPTIAEAGDFPHSATDEIDYWLGHAEDIDDLKAINWRLRVFHFRHPSLSEDETPKEVLQSLGDKLLSYAEHLPQIAGAERRRIIFIGAGTGGLVVKQALVSAAKGLADKASVAKRTAAVLFVGTPHSGSCFRSTWRQALQPPQRIACDSETLRELHQAFVRNSSVDLQSVNLFGPFSQQHSNACQQRWRENCVTESSATFQGYNVRNKDLSTWNSGMIDFRPEVRLQSLVDITLDSFLKLPVGSQHFEPILDPTSASIHQRITANWSRTPHAVRRSDLFRRLKSQLEPRSQLSASKAHTVELFGPSGSGKTQLALDFILTFREVYSAVLWIDATDKNSLIRSYERCAVALELPLPPGPSDTTFVRDHPAVQGVLRWLHQYQAPRAKWMMVFDGAETFWRFEDAIPRGLNGDILFTSRTGSVADSVLTQAEKIPVEGFTTHEAREVFLQPLYSEDYFSDGRVPADIMQTAIGIVTDLDYSPFAIELARTHMPQNPKVDILRQLREDLKASRTVLETGADPTSATRIDAISVVVNLSLSKIATQSDLKEDTLFPCLLLPFFASSPLASIEEDLFRLAQIGLASVMADERLLPIEYLNQSTTIKGRVDELFKDQQHSMTVDEQDRIITETSQQLRETMGTWPKLPSWFPTLLRSDASGEEWDRTSFDASIEPLVAYGLLKREIDVCGSNEDDGERIPVVTMHPTLRSLFRSSRFHCSALKGQPSSTSIGHEQEQESQLNGPNVQMQLFLALASRGSLHHPEATSANSNSSSLQNRLVSHLASAYWPPLAYVLEQPPSSLPAILKARLALSMDPTKVLVHAQHWSAAGELSYDLFTIRTVLFGRSAINTLVAAMDLGIKHVRRREWQLAAATLQDAVAEWERASRIEGYHPLLEAVKASLYLGRALLHMGLIEEGEKRLDEVEEKLLLLAEEIFWDGGKEMVESQRAYVPQLLDEMGFVRFVNQFRLDDAVRLEELAVMTSERIFGMGHAKVEKNREMLGIYVGMWERVGRFEEERKSKEAEEKEKKNKKKEEENKKQNEQQNEQESWVVVERPALHPGGENLDLR